MGEKLQTMTVELWKWLESINLEVKEERVAGQQRRSVKH